MIHIRLPEFHIRRCESCMIRFFCRDMCVAENTLRGVRVEPAAVSGQLGRSVQKPSRKSGDAAFFGSFIAALFCAHDETCHECSYFVMPDRQLCLERGAFLRYHIYIVHGRRFPRRSRYSCQHPHSPALHRRSPSGFAAQGKLPYQCNYIPPLRRIA